MARASHKTAPHTRTARISPRPLHGTPPERAHQITPPLHDQGACTSGTVVSQLGRLWGVRGVGVLDPGRGLSLIWLQPFPSNSPTHHNALTPPRTPPWCAPVHSTPGARPCTRHLVRARALDTWCAPVHSAPGARPCTRHLVRARALDTWCAPVHSAPGARAVHSTPGARPCTRHLVRARALNTWCAPVHSTPPLPTGAVVIPARSHDSVTH